MVQASVIIPTLFAVFLVILHSLLSSTKATEQIFVTVLSLLDNLSFTRVLRVVVAFLGHIFPALFFLQMHFLFRQE